MNQRIVQIAIVVKDYDEAIAFYTQKLNFDLLEDTRRSATTVSYTHLTLPTTPYV